MKKVFISLKVEFVSTYTGTIFRINGLMFHILNEDIFGLEETHVYIVKENNEIIPLDKFVIHVLAGTIYQYYKGYESKASKDFLREISGLVKFNEKFLVKAWESIKNPRKYDLNTFLTRAKEYAFI